MKNNKDYCAFQPLVKWHHKALRQCIETGDLLPGIPKLRKFNVTERRKAGMEIERSDFDKR